MEQLKSVCRISALVLVAIVCATIADIKPPFWTGAHSSHQWKQVKNWEDKGQGAPTSGNVLIDADDVCDPADDGSCSEGVCDGGYRDGKPCDLSDDCECLAASADYEAQYNYNWTPGHTFGTINVVANSTSSMTLRKGNPMGHGNKAMDISTLMLRGESSTRRAILDVDQPNMTADTLAAKYYVDIDVASGKTLTVDSEFLLEFGISDTFVELKGSGTLDVSEGSTLVGTSYNPFGDYTITLKVSSGTLWPGDLEVFGRTSARLAKFWWHGGTVEDPRSAKMMGYSTIDASDVVDGDINVNGALTVVGTGNIPAVATIEMYDIETLFEANSIAIQAGAGASAKLTISTGTLKCTPGDVELTGDAAQGYDAVLEISDSDADVDFQQVTLNNDSVLDVNSSLDLHPDHAGKLTIADSSADINIATGFTLEVDKLTVQGGVVADSESFGTGSKVRTN